MPSNTSVLMLLVKDAHEGHACDSHLLLCAILDYPHKKSILHACHFESTCKLVAHEYQVAFKLYHSSYSGICKKPKRNINLKPQRFH